MGKRVILLTGATGLVGSVLTEHWLKSGEHVVAVARSREKLESLLELLARFGGELSSQD